MIKQTTSFLESKILFKNVNAIPITIGDSKPQPSAQVKNIGATFDKLMKLAKEASITCRNAWHHLNQLGKIKVLPHSQLTFFSYHWLCDIKIRPKR